MSDDAAPSITAAHEALSALEEKEPMPLIYGIAFVGLAMYRAEKSEPVGQPQLRTQAESLGFRFLGAFSFASLFYGRTPREVWVDESGTLQVSMRRASARAESRIERMMAIYSLQTYFDDGSVIVTYGKKADFPSLPNNPRRNGTGFLDQDVVSHREAVRELAGDRKVLAFRDLDTFLRAETFNDTRTDLTTAHYMLVSRLLKLGVAIGIAFVLSRVI